MIDFRTYPIRMTAAERAKGRFMRAPDGHDSGGAPANAGGGSGDSGNAGAGENNTGQEIDLDKFWESPEPEPKPGEQQKSGSEEDNLGNKIQTAIAQTNFGEFMTPAVMAELAENKFDGFNKSINTAMQGAVTKAVELNAEILGKFGTALFEKVSQLIDEKSTTKDNADFLSKQIPSANNPKLRPLVDSVYAQALKINGGNRDKAIATTKAMMRTMTQSIAGDLNLNVVDADEAESFSPATSSVNWVSELMAKK